MGLEKYIIHGLSKVEMRAMNLPHGLAKTFNQMHARYRPGKGWMEHQKSENEMHVFKKGRT